MLVASNRETQERYGPMDSSSYTIQRAQINQLPEKRKRVGNPQFNYIQGDIIEGFSRRIIILFKDAYIMTMAVMHF